MSSSDPARIRIAALAFSLSLSAVAMAAAILPATPSMGLVA